MGQNITQKTILNGGLTVLTGFVPDEAEENYFINVEIGSGSADDDIDGQAHFLEHMLFNGVETQNGQIDFRNLKQTREKKGIHFGAYTTQSETRYTARIPKNLGIEGIKRAIFELSRMIVSPSLPDDRIAHEKSVIRNEWGHVQGSIDKHIYDTSRLETHRNNPAFAHRTVGEKDDINLITRESLFAFMASHYTQPNTSFSVAGPIDHTEVVKMVSEAFGDMPTNQRPDYPQETPIENHYEVSEIGFVPHCFFQVTLPWLGRETYEAETTINLAGNLILKRLNDVIREEGGQVYGLGAFPDRNRRLGDLIIATSSEPETVNHVIRAIGQELNRLVSGDITTDLETIKLEASNLQKASPTMAGLLVDFLTSDHVFGQLYDISKTIEEIEAVTVEDIQELYRQSLSGNRALVGMGPKGSFMPEAEFNQIMALQPQVQGSRLGQDFKPAVT